MKRSIKLTACVLAVLMVLTCIPLPAALAEEEPSAASVSEEAPLFSENTDASLSSGEAASNPGFEMPEGYHLGEFYFEDENGNPYYYIEADPSDTGWIDGYWVNAKGVRVDDVNTPMSESMPLDRDADTLPSAYDAREHGLITPVESQIGGTCWAHAAAAVMESNAIKKGIATLGGVDISEYHIAWYGRNSYYPGNTDSRNDGRIESDLTEILDGGGNSGYVGSGVNNFTGPVKESRYPFVSYGSTALLKEMQEKFSFSDKCDYDYVVTSIKSVPLTNEGIKTAVLDYGACQVSYYNDYNYSYLGDTCSYYYPNSHATSHAVTVVGWDDDFSIDHFKEGRRPTSNGAWLIKNSWGAYWGDNGYFWMSYEDATLSGPVVYEVADPHDFQNVYLYDGYGSYTSQSCTKAANVFTARGSEFITKVSRGAAVSNGASYSFKIYRLNDTFADPTDGELLYAQTGVGSGAKFIDLDEPVAISAGDRFSVVFDGVTSVSMELTSNTASLFSNSNPGESFYYTGGIWYDACVAGKSNLCIRAVTADQDDTVKVTYTDVAAYRLSYKAVNGVVALPQTEGYTWVCEYNGEPFYGAGVTESITVRAHCYPTAGAGDACVTEYKCIYCGEVMKDPVVHHGATEEIPAVAPTCSAVGYSSGLRCSVCGRTVQEPEQIEKTAHDFDTVSYPLTDTSIAYSKNICKVCGAVVYNGFKAVPANAYVNGASNSVPYMYRIYNSNYIVFRVGTYALYNYWGSYSDRAASVINIYPMEVVTKLGSRAFADMPNAKYLHLPHSLTELDNHAFGGLSKLEAFLLDNGSDTFTVIDGVLYNKDVTQLIAYPAGKADVYYKIPASVTSIAPYAFEGCSNLKYLDMSDAAVTALPANALFGLSAVNNINLPAALTSLAENSVSAASSETATLSALYIPASVTEVNPAFFGSYNAATAFCTDSSDAAVNALTDTCSVQVLPVHTHDYSVEVYRAEAAACNAPGLVVHTCACGQFVAEELTVPHTQGTASGVTAPTCGEQGFTSYQCTACGETYRDSFVPATGAHIWEWETVTAPICTADGIRRQVCSVCGAVQNENTHYSDPDAHVWAWVTVTEPTCGADGVQQEKCEFCDAVRNQNTAVPATGEHTWEWVADLPATCGATGVQHEACSVCDAVRSENTVIPITAEHRWVWIVDTEATCGTAGLKHRECSVCSKQRESGIVYPATGAHSFTKQTVSVDTLKSAATCTSPAVYYYCCAVCDAIEYKDTHTFTNGDALPHNYIYTVTPAAATCPGYTTGVCADCGNSYIKDITFYENCTGGVVNETLYWQIYNGVLSVYCIGKIPNFTASAPAPWQTYADEITSVYVNDDVTAIGTYAFAGLSNVQSLTLPDSLTLIDSYAFANNASLKEFSAPANLDRINSYAFSGVSSLESITYNDALSRIDSYAFTGLTKMKELVVPAGLTDYGYCIYSNCTNVERIIVEDGVTSLTNEFYSPANYREQTLREIVIPASVVNLSSGITGYTFRYTQAVNVAPENPSYTSVNGVLYNKNLTKLIRYPGTKKDVYFVAPASVSSLSESAFYCCWNIKYLDLSKTAVTELPYQGIGWFFSFTNINLPAGLTKVGNSNFSSGYNPSQVKKIYIPSSVTDISSTAFQSSNAGIKYMNVYTDSDTAAIIAACEANGNPYTVVPEHTHEFTTTVYTTAATCQTAGVTVKTCVCGQFELTESTVPHNYTAEEVKEEALKADATCATPAEYYYSCEFCGAVEGDDAHTFTVGETAAHRFEAQNVKTEALKTEATCTSAAVYYYSCAVCGEVEHNDAHTFTNGDPAAHTWQWITDTEATCGTSGVKHEECSVCHTRQSENTVISATGAHSWGWVTDTEPTCVDAGAKHEECDVCGLKRNENTAIAATGVHSFTKADEKAEALKDAATCTAEAVYYYSCAVCGVVEYNDAHTFTSGSMTQHSWEWVTDTEPTCGTPGIKHEECTVCHTKRNENTQIEATGAHSFAWITDSEATCGAAGVKHEECSVCHARRSENTPIEATGAHSFAWITDSEATCGAAGVKHEECSVCHTKRNENTAIAATGAHRWNWITDAEPDCANAGLKHQECTVCHAKQNENTPIESTGAHNYSKADVKAAALKAEATCTKQAEYYYSCTGCGEVEHNDAHTFFAGEMLAHTWEWFTDTEPTCGQAGAKHEECTVCHTKRSENTVIEATGNHSFTWITDIEPTCGQAGAKHEECTVCHAKRSENTVIEATGNHSFTWITDTEPTCVKAGAKHEECTVCHTKRNVNTAVEATGNHSWRWVTDTAATCGKAGSQHQECTVCGAKQGFGTSIPATGKHTWNGGTVTTPATCTSEGVRTFSCTVCGATKTETIGRANHVDGNGDGACDNCGTSMGSSSGKCKYCGKTHEGFWGKIVQLVHNILYFFKNLFK